ncbi:MAG: sugar phosphate isomerase/epimerase, partial [Clostridia bacterium]|nr:sugar phosphate isomerase/epimerase [Clostridia bacterium]
LLADGYHMSKEGESYDVLVENKDILLHCHVASSDRKIPGGTEYEVGFLDTLKKIGYDGIVTVECGFTDFRTEAALAADYLRKALA